MFRAVPDLAVYPGLMGFLTVWESVWRDRARAEALAHAASPAAGGEEHRIICLEYLGRANGFKQLRENLEAILKHQQGA